MADFLLQLQKLKALNENAGFSKPLNTYCDTVFFKLDVGKDGVYLTVVDDKMNPVDVDYRYYENDTAQMLHSIDNVMREKRFQIVWGEVDQHINLYEHPYLCYQLVRCPHIVNAKGEPISVAEDERQLKLLITEKGGVFVPRLGIDDADGRHKVDMMSDSFCLLGNVIYNVQSVGNNYRYFSVFESSFTPDTLGKFLSIFYSYFENIPVACEGYDISLSQQEVVPVPTLTFEKVDADKMLYLRLTEGVADFPSDFIENFGLNKLAVAKSEKEFEVKRLRRLPMQVLTDKLYDEIVRHAPSRQTRKMVFAEDGVFILPEEVAGPFLLQALPALIREYNIVGAEKLKEYKVRAVQPNLKVSLSSGIDFLEGSATVELGEDSFTLQQLLQQYNTKKYIQLSDGNRALLDNGYMRRLERIFKKGKKADKDKVKVSFFDLAELEALINGPIEGEAFKHHREFYEGFNALARQSLKIPSIKATLRPYQTEGVKWMKYLYDNNMGGCLADDMGLGKTLQTIGMLNLVYPAEKKTTLLVMPRSLLFNWQSEIARFSPNLSVYTYYGNTRDLNEAMKRQVVLTTYAIVRNDIETFRKQTFHYVILDESQNIKNVSTQSTQAVFMLNAEHRLALSGTPIENNLGELYSLFRFLNPAMFGSLDDFNARYANPIQKEGDKDAMQSLRRKIFPFMLRRLKRDVLKDLPDRTDKMLYVEMDKAQADFYEQRRSYYKEQVSQSIKSAGLQKSQFVMFQALSELRRVASIPESLTDGRIHSPKLEALTETLLDAVANGHKTVVFFNFIAGIELLSETLDENGIDYVCMTGSTHDRKSVVERFQNDPQCRVMLMTLKTGGVGLNLTAADTVFIFEPWWNKAAEEQAINRLHRFGQKAKVLCFSLITQGTIEEKIQQLQQQKADLFEGLIGSDTASTKHLSEEDINFILG